MPRLPVLATALFLASAAPAQGAQPPAPKRIRVAVIEIRPLGTEPHKAELLSEILLTEMTRAKRFDVIGRSDVISLIGLEKQKALLGCAEDASCLAEIGGALGVEYIVVGTLGRLGTLARVDLKLLDTRRSRVVERFGDSVGGGEEQLVAVAQQGAKALLDALSAATAAASPAAQAAAGQGAPPALRAAPEAAPASSLTPAPPAPAGAEESARGSRRRWAWIAGGAGVALAAGGVAFGLGANAALDDQRAASRAGDLTAYNDARDRARSRALVADVLYGVGAVGLGAGLYLGLTSRGPVAAGAAIVPTQGGLALVAGGEF